MKDKPLHFDPPVVIALAVFIAAFAVLVFYRGLLDHDETRYAEIGREMAERGNVWEMRLLGFRYYEKPPLTYWLTAAGIALFGSRDWAARFALFPSFLLLSTALWFQARKYWGAERGGWACLAASTSLLSALCLLMTDSYLVLWFTLTCLALFQVFGREYPSCSVPRSLAAGAFAGLGILTKGLVAFALPLLVLVVWLAWERRLNRLFSSRLLWFGAGAMAVLVPCLHLLEQFNPGFNRFFFVSEHLERFLGKRVIQGHEEPFWFYLQFLPALLLPWTLFIFRAVKVMARERALVRDAFSRFLLVWALVVLIFFSASSGKLISYILPAIPPLGMLLGRWGVAPSPGSGRGDSLLRAIGWSAVPLIAAVSAGFWLFAYFRVFPDMLGRPSSVSFLAFAPLLVFMAAAAFVPSWRRRGSLTLLSLSYLAAALVLSPLSGGQFNSSLQLSSRMYKELENRLEPTDQLVMAEVYRPGLAFYTARRPWLYQVRNELVFGMEMEPEREGYLADASALVEVMRFQAGRWLALVENTDLDNFRKEIAPLQTVLLLQDFHLAVVEILPAS